MQFKINSDFVPTGDQPEAIKQLVEGLNSGERYQTLLGVTGSGKTFSIANVIEQTQRPTLVLSHNKTLAAQLYGELQQFFPESRVEFFISYYDYYQPEAYIASSDTYIEKDLSINKEIEKLRLRTTAALLSERRDIIVVASVSSIYGIGRPEDFASSIFPFGVGDIITMNRFLLNLVDVFYNRSVTQFERGNFRVNGDTVDIFPAYEDVAVRVIFWEDEIESVYLFEPISGAKLEDLPEYVLYPANMFATPRERVNSAIRDIQDELVQQIKYFENQQRFIEAKRIQQRTEFDLEMMRELGYCTGIENYSRFIAEREPSSRPYCLLDYFPDDFLMVIDESHVTVSQVRAMYGGDRSRKLVLVENGFRLPSALDNRPLKFEEFEALQSQVIFVSATPGDYELEKCEGVIVEQVIRPTGLLDPEIDLRPAVNQVDDLLDEIQRTTKAGFRVLVTALTKRMSEELASYLENLGVKSTYLHSEIDALDRVDILRKLRLGEIDVLVGVNLLREGLDLPEVALVAILDADKEGFLRSERSLIQVAGRAARNSNGRVILYGDRISKAMQTLIDETNRRRSIQAAYNAEHGITPKTVVKNKDEILEQTSIADFKVEKTYEQTEHLSIASDPVVQYMSKEQLEKSIEDLQIRMEESAKGLDFISAAKYRDEIEALKEILREKE